MAQVGKPLMPWQREILRDAFGKREDGKWSAFEVGLFMPRQNGKGVIIEAMELYGLFMLRESQIIHSAHLFSTSQKSFQRLKELIDGSDWLTKRVAKISEAHGKEGFTLTRKMGGGQLEYKARTMHSARGFSGNRIVLDEAYSLKAGNMSAMTPTLLTLPNSQLTYFSSPPDDDTGPMPEDAFLPSVRRRGTAGTGRICYWEWSPPDGADPGNPDVWYWCNPSLGYLIDEEAMADQWTIYEGAGKVDKYTTEMLGKWPDDADSRWAVISEADYAALLDETSSARDPLVFGLDTTPERTHSSIAAVGLRADGDLHGEVVDHAPGTSWLVARAVELERRWKPTYWAIDAGGAAGFVIPALEAEGLTVKSLTTRNVGQAYGMFRSAASSEERGEAPESEWAPGLSDEDSTVAVPRLRIRPGRHAAAVAGAVEGAGTRRVGDGTSWDRRTTNVVISPLVALTNAVFGFMTRPPEVDQPFFGAWR